MKKILGILLLTVALLCMSACNKQETNNNLQALSIGIMPDVDSIPLIIAEHEGYFTEEGLEITLQHFKSAIDRDTALQTNNLDGAISDMLSVVFFNDNNFDIKMTSKTDGSFKLIASKNSNINTLDDINNMSIGISKNTIIDYLTDQIILTSEINIDHVNKVSIPKIPTRLEMLKNDKIDLATLPEPLASIAIADGGKLLSSSDKLNINPGVMVFTQNAISEKEEEIRKFYKAYNKAIAYLNNESQDNYMTVLIEEAGFPESIKDTLILPTYSEMHMPEVDEFNNVLNWMQSNELTSSDYSFDMLSDSKFID